MRYKEHTITKIEAQSTKLKTIIRAIEMNSISGPEAIAALTNVTKELDAVTKRLQLEPNE